MYRLFVLCVVFLFINYNETKKTKINLRPTIGILSQKVRGKLSPKVSSSEVYIAASYVKYLEMAGAQVVPLLSIYSKKRVLSLMQSLNGVLFPGGAAPLKDSKYINTAKIVFKEAKRLNDNGIHFPLWGTCLGFESLHNLAAGKDVLMPVSAENVSMELNLTQHAFNSRLFAEMDKTSMQELMFKKITLNMHNMGVSPDLYGANRKLNAMYRVLSTNFDLKGVEFVSTIEGVKYPFYGTQWHPEKNIFEWTRREMINHSPAAIQITQYFANFFVNEARKNFQSFPSIEEEEQNLIYKWAPVFSGSTSLFEQVYVFGNNTENYQQ